MTRNDRTLLSQRALLFRSSSARRPRAKPGLENPGRVTKSPDPVMSDYTVRFYEYQ